MAACEADLLVDWQTLAKCPVLPQELHFASLAGHLGCLARPQKKHVARIAAAEVCCSVLEVFGDDGVSAGTGSEIGTAALTR